MRVPRAFTEEVKAWLVNWRPQLVTMLAGMPNRQIHLDMKVLVMAVELMEESRSASNHLVKRSQQVSKYLNP